MGYKLATAFFLVLFVTSAAAQDAKSVLSLNDGEIRSFVQTTLDQGFPESRADQMTMLVLNKSAVVVPLLETRIEEWLNLPAPPQRTIDIAVEMIAYAGNEQSIRAVGKLSLLDNKRFGKLVGRTLDNAMNYGNPFTVAYRALDMGDPGVSQATASWCDSALGADPMKRLWAESMVERYGNVPGDLEWANDPIASRLRKPEPQLMREQITRFAEAVRQRRSKQQ